MAFDPSPATLFPIAASYVRLPSTAPSELAYLFSPAKPSTAHPLPTLLVFLNGLDIPMAIWQKCLRSLLAISSPGVSLLAYDRFGQGMSTDRHPKDAMSQDPSHGHDLQDAVIDLKELIEHIIRGQLGFESDLSTWKEASTLKYPRIVLVAHSIACQLAQLFASSLPGVVSGLVFLDPSPQTETGDFASLIPDPEAPGCSEEDLPAGVTSDGLKATLKLFRMVGNDVGSAEGLTKRNINSLLPVNTPVAKVIGRHSKHQSLEGPFLTILVHESDTFAEQQQAMTGIPRVIHKTYTQPFWEAFCQRLCGITDSDRVKGPIEVEGAGHLIMVDNPSAVITEIKEIVDKVQILG